MAIRHNPQGQKASTPAPPWRLHGIAMPKRLKIPDSLYARVGERLSWIREISGMSQAEIAKVFGMDQSTWAKWETGERQVSLVTMVRVCDAYGCTMDFLIRGMIGGHMDRDLELHLVARHPELMGAAAPARRGVVAKARSAT